MLKRDLHRVPWWLKDVVIRGFDDPKKKDGKDEESEESDDEEEDEEEEDDKGGQGTNKPDTDGLTSALRKERKARRDLEKEVKALRKKTEDAEGKEKSDADKAKDEASKATTKAQKLAEKLKIAAVDNAVTKLAGKLKFRDIDDALALVNREEIDVEQDEDEPDLVEIDMKTVEEALKDLAKRKPHLIVAEGQGSPSGGKFGGGRKSQQDMDEETLAKTYPALARGRVQARRSSS